MVHRITCLIPICKNTYGRNNTTTIFLEIFFIGYHFITARKVSTAISSLNERKKTFEKSQNTKPMYTGNWIYQKALPESTERRFNARK